MVKTILLLAVLAAVVQLSWQRHHKSRGKKWRTNKEPIVSI